MPIVALGAKFVQSRAGGQPATSTRAAWVVYPGYPWGLPDVGLGASVRGALRGAGSLVS